ncbi:hypothetical protein Moror_518 [Moniliophthora roreri MCA 2997]|uniref:Uncharacterized protein n=1 Tax=Moniliophthora roreri (strain MCA 2997) TaxID=1381753 RepID=V2XZI0_MONRO|nr:hypothetical protein Moror_518 [Moniliophthora roreri MCA 2997]KAI3607597.1 hypothetical protein WG66_004794 [Moniliophthora roreri]
MAFCQQNPTDDGTGITLCDICGHRFHSPRPQPVPMEILHPDYIPSASEISQICRVIGEEEEELKEYESEISRLRTVLDKLEAERLDLKGRIRYRKCVVSPIRRIPNELWTIIFDFLCVDRPGLQSQTLNLAAWHLSQVCSRWRRLVNSLPHLWSDITFDIYRPTSKAMMLLELCLKYSDMHPLRLRIYDGINGRSTGPPEPPELETYMGRNGLASFRTLMLHMTRCRHLELDVHWRVLSRIGDTVDVSFPLLQAFSCKTLFETEEHGTQWFWRAIHAAPQLRVVYTRSIVGFDRFPFHQLISLQVDYVGDINHALHVLEISPNLQSLAIYDGSVPFSSQPNLGFMQNSHFTASALQSLSISLGTSPTRYIPFFAYLSMPALRKLEIDIQNTFRDDIQTWRQPLHGMLQRSPHLQYVHLVLDVFSETPFLEILQASPNLLNLEVEVGYQIRSHVAVAVTPSPEVLGFLSRLTIHEDPSPAAEAVAIFPKLTNVFITERAKEIDYQSQEQFADKCLRLVESRSASSDGRIAPIRCFGIRLVKTDFGVVHHDMALGNLMMKELPLCQSPALMERAANLKRKGIHFWCLAREFKYVAPDISTM